MVIGMLHGCGIPGKKPLILIPDIWQIGVCTQQQTIVFPERCTRYVHIRSSGACTIENLHFKANITSVTYKGSFTCNDSLLNKIWAAGAATIFCCLRI